MLTKKDFKAIAHELALARPTGGAKPFEDLELYERFCKAVASGLAQTNPHISTNKLSSTHVK